MTETGQQLGNYRLVNLLGKGGFAEVYLGEHVYLKTQVAVKVLQTRLSAQEDMEGFLKEAQTVARLAHPNIVRILDFGVEGETPFLVMDYAPNGTLRQRHARGEMVPLATVTQYVKQVAEALQYAHDEKLIHRDVKPENILLGRRDEVLLGDFGIALVAQSSRYQSTQDVIGTVAYMSPEQIQGKPRPASDQYSLGIVVYEWLSGMRPFGGSFTELCTQHMFAPVPPLREKVPTLSQEVELVVNTALAKDPKQRFGNIKAFATALEQADQCAKTTLAATVCAPPPQPQPARVQPLQREAQPVTPAQPAPQPVQTPLYAYPAHPGLARKPYAPAYNAPYQVMAPLPVGFPPYKKQGIGWKLNKTQLLTMLIGTSLYFSTLVALERFNFNNFGALFISPIGNIGFLPSIEYIAYGASFVIPLFFGVRFGPWVGTVVAFGGVFLSDALFGSLNEYTLLYMSAWLLLGFVAGIAFVKTEGRYERPGSVGFGVLMSTIAVFTNAILQTIVFTIESSNPPLILLEQFMKFSLSNAFSIPLLLLALLIAGREGSNRQSIAR